MANDRGYADRDRGAPSGGRGAAKVQPWDLFRIVEVRKRDKTEDEWIQCGVLWRMKEREGLTWTMFFAIPEGSRMAALPRPPKEER